jgi:7-cyano-7-deazaguanine synthase in queuosine biosynthesis
MAKDLAVILNNGSINSLVTTALATQKYRPIMLYAEIGAQTGSRARAAYDQQVAHFKPYREHTLPMPFLSIFQPANSQAAAMKSDPRLSAGIGPVLLDLLPLISTALRFAVHYQAAAVYLGLRVGAQGDDLAQATEFIQIWNEMVQLPCRQAELEVITPLMELDPWQVVDVGFQAAAPFDKTWSCVEEMNEPCWACRGCRTREVAFQQSGKADPMRVVKKN